MSCDQCGGEGIVQGESPANFRPCTVCNTMYRLGGEGGQPYIPFSRHGVACFQRIWAKDCLVLQLVVGGAVLDQARVGWN